ncbi:MAG: phospholipase D family protein, partial [Verrucomicrobia bacterium]|nr:phospholipase D family protein [Verrucomicrobiota bacterium]
MRWVKDFSRGLLPGLVVAGMLSGCASVPERELENAFTYRRLKPAKTSAVEPIESEYQELASEAWRIMEAGGSAQFVSILERGDDALLARVHLIRSARKSIDLQTFSWEDDPTSRFVFDELVKAAERGVLVRVLIDALNVPAKPQLLARMVGAHRNLEIAIYKPLSGVAKRGPLGFWDNLFFKARRVNRRMHNKLLLTDGRIGIVGGRNYANAYFDRDSTFLFRDRDVVVAGPVVTDIQESFQLFWSDKNAVFFTQLLDVQKA